MDNLGKNVKFSQKMLHFLLHVGLNQNLPFVTANVILKYIISRLYYLIFVFIVFYSKEHNYEVATKRNVVGVRIRGESDLLQRNEKMTDGHIIKIASNCIVRINPVLNNLSKMK